MTAAAPARAIRAPATRLPAARRWRGEAAWIAGTGLAGALVVAGLAAGPGVPIAIALGLVMAAVAVLRPKAFVVLGLTVIVLTVLLERVGGAAAGNADEAVVALSVIAFATRRFVTEGRIVMLPGTVPLVGFLGAGLASSLLAHVPASIVLAAALLYLKAALYGFAVAQLRWSEHDLGLLLRAGGIAAGLTIGFAVINLALPDLWAAITTGRPAAHFGPIPALNGPFQHPAAMSRWCSLLAVGALVYAISIRSSGFAVVATAATAVIAVLTFEVKSLLGLIAAFAIVGLRSLRPLGAVALVCILPIGAVVAGPGVVALVAGTLDEYVFQQSARLRLNVGAADLALQHLPLGAGLGRWGSSPAAEHYSPLYLQYGFENVYGLSPRSPDFLNDTQWPAILGETGLAGTALMLLALVVAGASLLRAIGPAETGRQRWIRLSGLGWMFVLLVESSAAPVFVSTPSYPFLFLGAGIVASLRLDARARPDPAAAAEPVQPAPTAVQQAAP